MSQNLNDLKHNAKSASLSLTYSFDYLSTNSTWDGHAIANSTNYNLFNPASKATLTATEKTIFSTAMNLWADYSAFSVTLTTGKADINVYHATLNTSSGGTTGAFQNSTQTTANQDTTTDYDRKEIAYANTTTLTTSGYGWYATLHEAGHALGLRDLEYDTDYTSYMSVMSYNTPTNPNATVTVDHWAITPMAYDIAALQSIYTGSSFTRNHGNNDIYNAAALGVNGTGMTAQTIVDTGGTGDTIDLDSISGDHVIDLREAINGSDQWVTDASKVDTRSIVAGHEYLYIARGSQIENATSGSGNDTLIGNNASNVLTAGGGNDTLFGSAGTDTLNGGTEANASGDLVDYSRYNGSVVINLSGGNGTAVKSGGGTDTLIDIERVRGNQGNDEITNGTGSITIYGSEGIDEIDGGAGSGSSISYEHLTQGITSTMTASTWTVSKGSSGSLGTDDLSNLSGIGGTSGDDVFNGFRNFLTYAGGGGRDTYNFSLSGPASDYLVEINEELYGPLADSDLIAFSGLTNLGDFVVGDMNMDFHFGGSTINVVFDLWNGGPFYTNIITVLIDTGPIDQYPALDIVSINGDLYSMEDLIVFADAHTGNIIHEDDLDDVYGAYVAGSGNDSINASGAGAGVRSSLFGGNDSFLGSAYADSAYGYDGNDTIEGGGGNDTLLGGTGTDTVSYAGAGSAVTVNLSTTSAQNTFGAGTDTIAEFENLTGSAYNDTLTGDANANTINGGNGNDVIEGGGGNDTLSGGGNTDRVTYANAAAGVIVSLANGSAQNTVGAGTDTISGFENLTGSAFNDILTGDGSANVIAGGNGDDVIDGGAGNDTLNGDGGTDTLTYASAGSAITINLATATGQNTGGAGTDTISGFENVIGSAYNDTLTGTSGNNIMEGGAGNDSLNGSGGTDTLSYANAGGGITISLAVATGQSTGGAGTDTISSFENLIGSAYNDTLTGTSSSNVMEGGAGNDTLNGSGGTDTLSYSTASSGVTVSLAVGTAQNTGGAGTDTITSFENLTGSAHADTLTGTSGINVIDGGNGNDTVLGSGGDDTLTGGGGTDTLSYANYGAGVWVDLAGLVEDLNYTWSATVIGFENAIGSIYHDELIGSGSANVISGGNGDDWMNGGNGDDTLIGGGGSDTIYGSSGIDTFVFEMASAFSSQDTLMDFSLVQGDKLDLHDILDVEFDSLTEAIGDFVNFTNSGANSIMSIDRDGAGVTYGFVNVATLEGLNNLDETTLYTNGNLLAA